MDQKSKVIQSINLDNLKNHYWLKVELINFCKNNGLSTVGLKQELVERIEVFMATGNRIKSEPNKQASQRDSDQSITRNTPVVNYKNDTATRKFFEEQVDQHFRFDTYLRQFTNKNNITPNLTYGDLVVGWLAEESKRKDPHYKSTIGTQFEYNQFIRDFFANEKGKSKSDAIKAWNIVKTWSGARTYAQYKNHDRSKE